MEPSSLDPPSSTATRHRYVDTHALRRIGEALLLAQNRARVSTDRANQYERVLRTVLSQINLQSGEMLHELEENPRRASFDSLSQWELVLSEQETSLSLPVPPSNELLNEQTQSLLPNLPTQVNVRSLRRQRQSAEQRLISRDGLTMEETSTVPVYAHDEDLWLIAKEIVVRLHVAALDAKRRVQSSYKRRMRGPFTRPRGSPMSPTEWLYYVFHVDFYPSTIPSWHYLTAFVLGVALGASISKQLLLRPTTSRVVSSLLTNPFTEITRLSQRNGSFSFRVRELLEDITYPIEVGG